VKQIKDIFRQHTQKSKTPVVSQNKESRNLREIGKGSKSSLEIGREDEEGIGGFLFRIAFSFASKYG